MRYVMTRSQDPNTGSQDLQAESGAGGRRCPKPKQEGKQPTPGGLPTARIWATEKRAGWRGPARQRQGKGMGSLPLWCPARQPKSPAAPRRSRSQTWRRPHDCQPGRRRWPAKCAPKQPRQSVSRPATAAAAASTRPCTKTAAGVLSGPRRSGARAVLRSAWGASRRKGRREPVKQGRAGEALPTGTTGDSPRRGPQSLWA